MDRAKNWLLKCVCVCVGMVGKNCRVTLGISGKGGGMNKQFLEALIIYEPSAETEETLELVLR